MVIYVIVGGALALLLVLSIHAAKTASRAALTNGRSLTRLEDKVAEGLRSVQQEFEAMASTQRTEASIESTAEARQSLELQTEIRALTDLQAREFSRVRAMLDVLPHSVGALQRALTQIQESAAELKAQLDAASAAQGEHLAQIRESRVELRAQLDAVSAAQTEHLTQIQESTVELKVQLDAASNAQGEHMAQIRANLPSPKASYEDPVPFIEGMSEPDVLRIAEALTFVRPMTPYPNWYFDADWQNADLGYRIRRSIWTYFSRRKVFAALDVPWYGRLKLRIYLGNDQSRQQFIAGCLDPNEFALLDKLLTPGMVFMDVGANEGFYSVFASRRVGETGSVWAFEPSRREMERLTANVGLNGLANVRPFCVALADEDGDAELLIASDEHSGHNTLGHFVYESGLDRREPVRLRRLDSLVQESTLERLDFLKIDAEGAEMRVLAGAGDALRKFRPFILLEMNDPSLKAQGSSRDKVIRHLESQDYRLYLFDPATGLPVPAFEGRYGDNMLAVPVERNLPEPALLPLPAIGR
jgi:FkbM family methyltransferase